MALRLNCIQGSVAILTLFLCAAGAATMRSEVADGLAAAQPTSAAAGPVSEDSVPVPEPDEKAVRFYRGGNALWCVRALWELFVPALILFTGFSARIRD